MINLNLNVQDVPLWYENPAGPDMELRLSYNSQSAIANYEPFGSKWTCNFASYLVVDTGNAATLFMPDGRRDVYLWDSLNAKYTPPVRVHNQLVVVGTNSYDLVFPDGTVYEYRIPAGTASLQPMLTRMRDANDLGFQLGYNTNVQLVTISDHWARVTSLAYSNGFVTSVTDPFGRSAQFGYDANGNLTSLTDMGGYACTLSYDTNVYLTAISNALGVWGFYFEPADFNVTGAAFPMPGGPMFRNQRLTITQPCGARHEYFWNAAPDANDRGAGWYVAPRDYVPWQGSFINNGATSVPKTVYHYQGVGVDAQIESVRLPHGGTYAWTYGPAMYPTSYSNSLGHVWTYTHNALGNVTSIGDPASNLFTYTYATNGHDLLVSSNALGARQYFYDARHQVTSAVDEVGGVVRFDYNALGQRTRRVDQLGLTNVWHYDANDRLERVSRNGQTLRTYAYDAYGRLSAMGDAVATNRFGYNLIGAVTSVVEAGVATSAYRYATGYPRVLEEAVEAAGGVTRYEYDPLLRPTTVRDAEGAVVRFEYDANGNAVSATDPGGSVIRYTYDLENRLVAVTNPAGGVTTIRRNPFGVATNVTRAAGASVAYDYDHAGRVTRRTRADGGLDTYTYDAVGKPVIVTCPVGTNVIIWDARGLPVVEVFPDGLSVSNVYDARGLQTARIIPGGVTVQYDYDATARLTNMTWAGESVTFKYDAADRLVAISNQNGLIETRGLDARGLITNILLRAPTGVVADLTYARDLRGLVTNALAVATPSPAYPAFAATNRMGLRGSGNRMLSWGDEVLDYDADGLATNKTGSAGFRVAYDGSGLLTNLVSDSTNSIFRDAYDRPIVHRVNDVVTRWHYDVSGRPLFETDTNGTVRSHAIHGGGRLLARGGPVDGYQRLHADAGGHVYVLSDTNGLVSGGYTYLPFGAVAARSDSGSQPFTALGAGSVRLLSTNLLEQGGRLFDADTASYVWPGAGGAVYDASRDFGRASQGAPPVQSGQFSYDAQGRLCRVIYAGGTQTDYLYDHTGHRVHETTTLPGGGYSPPTAPTAPTIASGATQIATSPVLGWAPSTDPDAGDTIRYYLYFGTPGQESLVWSGLTNTTPLAGLQALTAYSWYVVARDNRNLASTGAVWTFTTTNPPPVVDFAAHPTNSAIPPFVIAFSDLTASPDDAIASWQWDFGDGSFTNASEPIHTYASGGVFSVTLRVVDEHGATGVLTRVNYITLVGGDTDGDGVPDFADNCPYTYNALQADLDGDSIGDECDPDMDGDGVPNDIDNCGRFANPGQEDADGDGFGDACTFGPCVTSAVELQTQLDFASSPWVAGNIVIRLQTGIYRVSDNSGLPFRVNSSAPYAVKIVGGYSSFCAQWTNDPALTVLDGEHLAQAVQAAFTNGSPFAGFHLENLTIRNGLATNGGGLSAAVRSGRIVLKNCILHSNDAYRGGGARLETVNGSIALERVRVATNAATSHAGLDIVAPTGSVRIVNCLFAENNAEYYAAGVGIAMNTGTIRAVNNTFARNRVALPWGMGGGLYLAEVAYPASRVDLVNNLFWTNAAAWSSASYAAGGGSGTARVFAVRNLQPSNTVAGQLESEAGTLVADPLLVNPAAGDYRLSAGSPVIGAGTNVLADLPAEDLDGLARIMGGVVDLGAFEFPVAPDADGDGIPDWWEVLHYGGATNANPAAWASNGVNSVFEAWIADLNPTNAGSAFPPLKLTNAPSGAAGLLITPTSTARLYRILANTNLLAAPQTWTPFGAAQTGTGTGLTFIVTNDLPQRNFRSGVQLP